MKKYLQITTVLAIFLTTVLLHDLHSGGQKLTAAAQGDTLAESAFATPAVTSPNSQVGSAPTATATPSAPSPTPVTPLVATNTPAPTTPTSQSGGVSLGLTSVPTQSRGQVPPPATPTPLPRPTATPTPQRVGLYKDGTYTGGLGDAYYGYVQVQAVIANGRLIDVKFLQYPDHARTSRSINLQVMPWLTQEAVQAQSTRINNISGASATSYAFAQSLASALSQAK